RVGELVRSLEREAGLAAAPWAGEGDEADVRAAQERADLVELVSAADESRLGGGEGSARPGLGGLDPGRRGPAKDRLLERSQLWAWLEAELLAQRVTDLAESGQGTCLPATSVEREHELTVQAFAERLVGDERFQLGNELDVSRKCQVSVDPLLER